MCLSCGCGEPDNDHGDERHITAARLAAAANAAGISPKKSARNVRRGFREAAARKVAEGPPRRVPRMDPVQALLEAQRGRLE